MKPVVLVLSVDFPRGWGTFYVLGWPGTGLLPAVHAGARCVDGMQQTPPHEQIAVDSLYLLFDMTSSREFLPLGMKRLLCHALNSSRMPHSVAKGGAYGLWSSNGVSQPKQ